MFSPYFKAVVIGEEAFDLSHLEPFTFRVFSQLAKKSLRVHVTYSNHCFSKAYDVANHPPGEPIIDKGLPRPRAFCPTRYRLSFRLPALINSFANSETKVRETASQRNWCYSVTIDDPEGRYHIFFDVRRASQERRQWQDLQIVVESAYHEDGAPPNLKGSMGFALLCGKVYRGERTSTMR